MSGSLKVDLAGLDNLIKKFDSPTIKTELEKLPQEKAVAALVSQAIAENFALEGPGWAPLKAQTIRYSVNKAMRKKLKNLSGDEIERFEKLIRTKSRNKYENRDLFNLADKMNHKSGTITSIRKILQKTGLLKKTVTTPNFSGTNKEGVSGANIYKVEGTNLVWGTSLPYAATHNKGNPQKNIPKREFLVIRKVWMDKINQYLIDRILKVIRSELRREG